MLSIGTDELEVVSVATLRQNVVTGLNGKFVEMKYGSVATYNVSASSLLHVQIEEKVWSMFLQVAQHPFLYHHLSLTCAWWCRQVLHK